MLGRILAAPTSVRTLQVSPCSQPGVCGALVPARDDDYLPGPLFFLAGLNLDRKGKGTPPDGLMVDESNLDAYGER